MSTEAEYRISTRRSRLSFYAVLAVHALLLGAILLWQPQVWHWQSFAQWGLALAVVLSAITSAFRKTRTRVFNLDEQGHWLYLDEEGQPLQIDPDSRISPLMLWICLRPRFSHQPKQWFWLFRDAVSETDYRRLCRIIRRITVSKDVS
ncbi:hypothetical protein P2G88_06975 [Aliiglaciecola sp. CAU 1673]|uniref:protein YgfX n=1 Tax=Aliiglaciecola sp. CAU 1673 TaxID=3032595 RepID=UPI0023DBD95F|nr:protein YgfX [Aliiglaciecola sp. CAU 1673]MDF2177991.1 hypothetical protein [Aliiglaciecola sp. CAU 1673]